MIIGRICSFEDLTVIFKDKWTGAEACLRILCVNHVFFMGVGFFHHLDLESSLEPQCSCIVADRG